MGYAAKLGGKGSGGSIEPVTGTAEFGTYTDYSYLDTGLDDITAFWMFRTDEQTTLHVFEFYPIQYNNQTDYYTACTLANQSAYSARLGIATANHLPSIMGINGGVLYMRGGSWQGTFQWYAI